MYGLIAYIEGLVFEIESGYSISEREVIEIIKSYYDESLIETEEKPNYKIDQYWNWEFFCGTTIHEFEGFKKEGVFEYMKDMAKKNNW